MSSYLDPFSNVSKAELGCPSRPPFVIRGPGVAAFINTDTGTLGFGNQQPGLAIGGVEFLAPGSPFEGFTVEGWLTANNLQGSGFKTCTSGNEQTARTRICCDGLTVVHVYQAIDHGIRCTVTLINTSQQSHHLRYARFIDPDPTTDPQMDGDKVGWETRHRFSSNQVSASHANGTLHMRIDSAGFATGTGSDEAWRTNFALYFNGRHDTPGDNTIGVAVDFGRVDPGDSVTAVVTYF